MSAQHPFGSPDYSRSPLFQGDFLPQALRDLAKIERARQRIRERGEDPMMVPWEDVIKEAGLI